MSASKTVYEIRRLVKDFNATPDQLREAVIELLRRLDGPRCIACGDDAGYRVRFSGNHYCLLHLPERAPYFSDLKTGEEFMRIFTKDEARRVVETIPVV